jgi:hypothetical protein
MQRQQVLVGKNVAAQLADEDGRVAVGLLVRLLTVNPLVLLLVKG